jgi:hypothetical protein
MNRKIREKNPKMTSQTRMKSHQKKDRMIPQREQTQQVLLLSVTTLEYQ